MKPDEIHSYDWMRIIFGEVPAEFYIEILIRGAFVYLLLLASLRLLGKRMAGQLSRLDMTAMVALASSIGVSILSPVNGILPPLIIAVIIVLITRLIASLSMKSERFEFFSQGSLDTLIEDGVMKLDTMRKVRVTRERLFAQLRSSKIQQLGGINRMYMEADGSFSMVKNPDEKPGLLVLPDWDKDFVETQVDYTGIVICKECGAEKPHEKSAETNELVCINCGENEWTKAVVEKKS